MNLQCEACNGGEYPLAVVILDDGKHKLLCRMCRGKTEYKVAYSYENVQDDETKEIGEPYGKAKESKS